METACIEVDYHEEHSILDSRHHWLIAYAGLFVLKSELRAFTISAADESGIRTGALFAAKRLLPQAKARSRKAS
jgi:hypothetical protein